MICTILRFVYLIKQNFLKGWRPLNQTRTHQYSCLQSHSCIQGYIHSGTTPEGWCNAHFHTACQTARSSPQRSAGCSGTAVNERLKYRWYWTCHPSFSAPTELLHIIFADHPASYLSLDLGGHWGIITHELARNQLPPLCLYSTALWQPSVTATVSNYNSRNQTLIDLFIEGL